MTNRSKHTHYHRHDSMQVFLMPEHHALLQQAISVTPEQSTLIGLEWQKVGPATGMEASRPMKTGF